MNVVFTHMKPEIWQYKTALALRRKGVKTISVSLKAFDRKLFENAFDEIVSLNLPSLKPNSIFAAFLRCPLNFVKFFYKLLTIKADAAICQGAPHYLAAFFVWLFGGRMKRIYFPYDFNFSRFDDPSPYFPGREIWGEKYSFMNCDGVICKAGIGELELLPESFGVRSKPRICFPCYTLKEWFAKHNPKNKLSYKNSDVHIVYAGLVVESPTLVSILDSFSGVIKEKIHLHLYCVDSRLNRHQVNKMTDNDKKLEKYLHEHEFVSPEKLPKEISKYDYGIFPIVHTKIVKPEAVKYDAGNKIATYLESCIPIIVKEENLYNSRLAKENYLGTAVSEMKNLREQLKCVDYFRAVKSIEKFRAEYSAENRIQELINFIESLAKSEAHSGVN